MVTILLMPWLANRRANSCAQCIISSGSNWWLRKLLTSTMFPYFLGHPVF
ncbi:MAG: hypothetical protein IJQ20_08630 [Paludibacteraceae bacterium]|nr:hypothetical protein [Paludibacteraceae bacterium]